MDREHIRPRYIRHRLAVRAHMTTLNYPATAATATRLLKRFGAPAVLGRDGPAVYDPTTGTVAPTPLTFPTTAAVFAYAQKYIDGTLILQGDQ